MTDDRRIYPWDICRCGNYRRIHGAGITVFKDDARRCKKFVFDVEASNAEHARLFVPLKTVTEQEIVDRYSTPGLKRNEVSRSTKKLNMEFDERFKHVSKHDREEFLNQYFPEWPKRLD